VQAMREAFELTDGALVVPAGHAHFVAVGAAIDARAAGGSAAAKRIAELHAAGEEHADRAGRFPTMAPLSMERVLQLRDQVKPFELPYDGTTDVYLGIDIGSVSTNLVLIDDEGNMVDEVYVRTRGRPIEVVTENLLDMQQRLGPRICIRGVGTTGSGRELIGSWSAPTASRTRSPATRPGRASSASG
jgi:activator of 2-hydroxyglutaryl-CoA dehydratase